MAGFADLVLAAQPSLASVEASATQDCSWRWSFVDVVDGAGNAVDLTACTGTCVVRRSVNGAAVVTLTFTGALGSFVVSADESLTAALVSGVKPLRGVWGCQITNGTDVVQAWRPNDSPFTIWSD